MAFKTNRLVVSREKSHLYDSFEQVQDIPGYNDLVREGYTDVIEFCQNNLDDIDLCLQAVKHKTSSLLFYNETRDLVSAAGWHVVQLLGQGKDGVTFLGYRYNDKMRKIKTVKYLSNYAQNYINHTVLFTEMFRRNEFKNDNFFKLYIRPNYTYYNNSSPLNEVTEEKFDSVLPELCKMNSWSIKHTGFAFWDFGYGSGRNYMIGNDSKLKWIDYGGSGIVRCPNFEGIYQNNTTALSEIELTGTFFGKESLIIADSDFLMCQFLLHIDYWKNRSTTNADVWSSMLQIKLGVVKEFVGVLPNILSTDLSKSIYNTFKKHDWTDDITWKQVGKHINENT